MANLLVRDGAGANKYLSTSGAGTDGDPHIPSHKVQGAANMANGQIATSTAAATLVAARATRRSVVIKNMDATITVYVGVATVTAANGLPLLAGESVSIDWVGLIQVIAASGTPSVAYCETFD